MSAYGTKRTSRVQVVMSAIARKLLWPISEMPFPSHPMTCLAGHLHQRPQDNGDQNAAYDVIGPIHTQRLARIPHTRKTRCPIVRPPTDAVIVSHFQSADLRRNHALS